MVREQWMAGPEARKSIDRSNLAEHVRYTHPVQSAGPAFAGAFSCPGAKAPALLGAPMIARGFLIMSSHLFRPSVLQPSRPIRSVKSAERASRPRR